MNFQIFKLDLEKAEEARIKLVTSVGSSKKQEKDGGGIGWGDHFLFYKFIERTTEW